MADAAAFTYSQACLPAAAPACLNAAGEQGPAPSPGRRCLQPLRQSCLSHRHSPRPPPPPAGLCQSTGLPLGGPCRRPGRPGAPWGPGPAHSTNASCRRAACWRRRLCRRFVLLRFCAGPVLRGQPPQPVRVRRRPVRVSQGERGRIGRVGGCLEPLWAPRWCPRQRHPRLQCWLSVTCMLPCRLPHRPPTTRSPMGRVAWAAPPSPAASASADCPRPTTHLACPDSSPACTAACPYLLVD